MESAGHEFDKLDRQILRLLQDDARLPYLEMARQLNVSGGTIHQRLDKMKKAGLIKGQKLEIDYRRLGLGVTVLLGIHLVNAKTIRPVTHRLEKIEEVCEIYYTTGNFAFIIKVICRDIDHFHHFLINKLQAIEEVRSTESFICLDTPLKRDIKIN